MRVRSLNIGVESISHWEVADEVHLPSPSAPRPAFLPLHRPLDEILRRPSLDERLPKLLQPEFVDPDMLEPAVLTEVREEARELMALRARRETGRRRHVLEQAAACLSDDINLDDEVRHSLAALLRG
jgi:hypothetical protein